MLTLNLAFIGLFILGIIYHCIARHNMEVEHEDELAAVRRKQFDHGFSRGWAQCHQAMSLKIENAEALRLQARRNQIAMEAANARLKYFDREPKSVTEPSLHKNAPRNGNSDGATK